MKSELIETLTETFEGHAQLTDNGVEYWLARDLQVLLGYTQWRNFLNVISKAETACEGSGHQVEDHFADVSKMVGLGSGSQREVEDVMLTRYACYLVAQNGDPQKQEIAFAQTYFAIQTRKAELIEILIPPVDLIVHFNALAEQTHLERANLQRRNKTLRSNRDLLLPKLLESTE